MAFGILLAVLVGLSSLVIRDGGPVGKHPRRWVAAMLVVVVIAGMAVRLTAFDRSLWIDEFGTLWAIESSLGEAWSRPIAFHGQSPLYYLLLWPLVHGLGESEILLRLPSLACAAAATVLIYRTAKAVGSREAGRFAAILAWTSPVLMESSVNARPYALAMLWAALALYGFTVVMMTQHRRYRMLFVAGGAGLFLTQYVSSLMMVGLGAGYLGSLALQSRYPRRAFLTDVGVQCGVVLFAMAQIRALWQRREDLDWVGSFDYRPVITVLGPFLLPILVTWIHARPARDPAQIGVERAIGLAILAQVALMGAIAAIGPNLFVPRYLMVVGVPASILAGLSLSRLRTPAASVSLVFAVVVATVATIQGWRASGVPTTLPHQDWRAAIEVLDAELETAPAAPVLYRPGFVEQDPRIPPSPALVAPLRSPGRSARERPIVPLTFSWFSPSRETYFAEVLTPMLIRADVFFVLISGTTPTSGNYPELLLEWINVTFPNQFVVQSLGPFPGLDLLRFDRRITPLR